MSSRLLAPLLAGMLAGIVLALLGVAIGVAWEHAKHTKLPPMPVRPSGAGRCVIKGCKEFATVSWPFPGVGELELCLHHDHNLTLYAQGIVSPPPSAR